MTTFNEDVQLSQLFHARDFDRSGYLDQDELASLCSELSFDDLCHVFEHLDKDGDGRISIEEFAKGLREITMAKETKKRELIRRRLASARSEENLIEGVSTTDCEAYSSCLDEGLKALSCQEDVCELYQNLHSVDRPQLVAQFENFLLNVINDVRQYQLENERLEQTYKREKEEHDKHIQRLEEEMEQQVQSVEEKVRQQEKEHLELEKIEIQNQLGSEIAMLQQNLRKLQQNGESRLDKGDHLVTFKKRLEENLAENRMFRSELSDVQTNLALIKSQMTTVKHQLDEKNYQLEVESRTVEDYVSEIDKLRRQLHMLHEINKNLLDTNDSLRERLDSVPSGYSAYRRTSSKDSAHSTKSCITSPCYQRKVSIVDDYVDVYTRDHIPFNQQTTTAMMPDFLTEHDEDDSITEDLDSGHSTLRDTNDDTELDSVSLRSDMRERQYLKQHPSVWLQEEDLYSHCEMNTDTERPDSPHGELFRYQVNHNHSPSVGCKIQSSLIRCESFFSQSSKSSKGFSRRQLPTLPTKEMVLSVEVSREPERMYKLVLAGDVAVGKSCFIVRLCKGKFEPNLSSTLGVDFQTKMLDVDGHPIALQMWDTAGQERFRSVARTYFRRADGVLLLYDVTYERSFLNLREWVDAIEERSGKRIPVMLVGNKTDARQEMENLGKRVVKHEHGLRLSQEIDALFIETSAKDGTNIIEAVIELTRLLRTNEDMEIKTVGLQLQDLKSMKSASCCKR